MYPFVVIAIIIITYIYLAFCIGNLTFVALLSHKKLDVLDFGLRFLRTFFCAVNVHLGSFILTKSCQPSQNLQIGGQSKLRTFLNIVVALFGIVQLINLFQVRPVHIFHLYLKKSLLKGTAFSSSEIVTIVYDHYDSLRLFRMIWQLFVMVRHFFLAQMKWMETLYGLVLFSIGFRSFRFRLFLDTLYQVSESNSTFPLRSITMKVNSEFRYSSFSNEIHSGYVELCKHLCHRINSVASEVRHVVASKQVEKAQLIHLQSQIFTCWEHLKYIDKQYSTLAFAWFVWLSDVNIPTNNNYIISLLRDVTTKDATISLKTRKLDWFICSGLWIWL